MNIESASNPVDVQIEEIIVHPIAEQDGNGGWKGEARISGNVTINGQPHVFEHVVPIHFVERKPITPASAPRIP